MTDLDLLAITHKIKQNSNCRKLRLLVWPTRSPDFTRNFFLREHLNCDIYKSRLSRLGRLKKTNSYHRFVHSFTKRWAKSGNTFIWEIGTLCEEIRGYRFKQCIECNTILITLLKLLLSAMLLFQALISNSIEKIDKAVFF